MKITKRQLKRLIREEVETLDYGKDYLSRIHPGGEGELADPELDYDHPSDVKAQRGSWAGGPNVHLHVDHGEASGGGANTKGQEIMKVTESQLKKIIKEIINEAIRGRSVRTQVPFIDTVVSSLEAGDPVTAANAIMNSYMIDDTFVEEEDALIDILGGLPYGASVDQIEMAADAWLENYRAGNLRP